MLGVMRDSSVPADRRDRMAAAVAPYVHAKLATVERIEAELSIVNEEERRQKARREIDMAFREREIPRIGQSPIIEHAPLAASAVEEPVESAQSSDVVAERGEPPPLRPREFSREGPLAADPNVARLPTRYRPPKPSGSGWSA
jgi:hypothetical protein